MVDIDSGWPADGQVPLGGQGHGQEGGPGHQDVLQGVPGACIMMYRTMIVDNIYDHSCKRSISFPNHEEGPY